MRKTPTDSLAIPIVRYMPVRKIECGLLPDPKTLRTNPAKPVSLKERWESTPLAERTKSQCCEVA